MGFWERITVAIKGKWAEQDKQKFALICTGVFVAILTISVIISIVPRQRDQDSDGEGFLFGDLDIQSYDFQSSGFPQTQMPIPAEELFLPDEPDFLPGVLLERERRENWTEVDAQEYWQDPLRFGEEQWRDKVEAAINEMLERIP